MVIRVQPGTALESLLVAIESFVDNRIARVLASASSGVYSTEKPGLYPPGKRNPRPARDAIRDVPGHTRTGRGKATVWSVSRDAYHAHHTRVAPSLRIVPAQVLDDEAIADAALEAAGLRSTKTRRSA